MNSSPDSASMDEIVFVPLMIDESSSPSPPPSRHRSSNRRKPKHPQKLTSTPSSHQNHDQLHRSQSPPPAKSARHSYDRQSSSSGYSSGEQSSGNESFKRDDADDGLGVVDCDASEITNLYFGESNSFLSSASLSSDIPASTGMYCRVEEEEDYQDDGVGVDKPGGDGGLSYKDLTAHISSSPSGVSSQQQQQQHKSNHDDLAVNDASHELFMPAPTGDGYYILTTTSPPTNHAVKTEITTKENVLNNADDDAGFSIYDNMPLNDYDDDDDSDERVVGRVISNSSLKRGGAVLFKTANSSSSTSSNRRGAGKLRILTMEMRPDDDDDDVGADDENDDVARRGMRRLPPLRRHRPRLVETTINYDTGNDIAVSPKAKNTTTATTNLVIVKSENGIQVIPASNGGHLDKNNVDTDSNDDNEENDDDDDDGAFRNNAVTNTTATTKTSTTTSLVKCEHCDRLFDDDTRMRRHVKLVHGPKSFFCPECSKSFTQYGHMQVHLRTVHTSAKPFECNVCHRKFNVSSNRNRHQRLHFTKGSLHFVPDGASLVMAGNDTKSASASEGSVDSGNGVDKEA